MEFNDSLELKQSDIVTVGTKTGVNVDLSLSEITPNLIPILTGTVYDTTLLVGAPINDATVVVYNNLGAVVAFTKTNALGIYTINTLSAGPQYSVTVAKDGYNTSVASVITLSILEITTQNFVLTPNANTQLNTIYGIVSNDTDEVVEGATIVLVDPSDDSVITITESIDDGEYAIYNIPTGTYKIKAIKDGFFSNLSAEIPLTTSTNHDENITLNAMSDVDNGIISGVITNNESQNVPNAFVGLYSVSTEDTPETLIDYTFTNTNGRYIFGNVVPGNYIVKAKLAKEE